MSRLKAYPFIALSALIFSLSACAGKPGPVGNANVPQPAKAVDLNTYLGRWYEYARYEAPFQKDCEAVTADYSMRDDGMIKVVNSCRAGAVDGSAKQSIGKAKIMPGTNNAKLKVSFFGPFYGDYWVLDRAEDYSWAIIGEPSGRYLWMLSRVAKPSTETAALIERRVKELGYNWSLVRKTKH